MSKPQYIILLRVAAVIVSVLIGFISILFSVDGFNFQVTDSNWMGLVLAVSIIVIELVWNQQGLSNKNVPLMLGGIFAYGYGILTNIIGIATNQGALTSEPLRYVLPTIMGVFLEIIVEPLFLWGVLGGDSKGSGFNLFSGFGKKANGNGKSNRPQNLNDILKRPQPQVRKDTTGTIKRVTNGGYERYQKNFGRPDGEPKVNLSNFVIEDIIDDSRKQ